MIAKPAMDPPGFLRWMNWKRATLDTAWIGILGRCGRPCAGKEGKMCLKGGIEPILLRFC